MDKLALLAEANRRGILPAEKKPLFDEAVRRGLIQADAPQEKDNSLSSYVPTDTSTARTIIDRAYNGLTLGNFGDEIQAAGGALAAKVYGLYDKYLGDNKTDLADTPISELYNQGLEVGRRNRDAQFKERPVLSTVSEIGGSLATGLLGAKTAAGQALGRGIGSGGTAARVVKGAGTGAAFGGAAGFGAGEGGFDERLKSAGDGAVIGGLAGGAIPAVGAAVKSTFSGLNNVVKGLGARTAEQLDEVSGGIRNASRQAYAQATKSGATLNKAATSKVFNSVKNALNEDGILDPQLHDKATRLLSRFSKDAKKGTLSIEELDNLRKVAGEVAGNFSDKVNARKASLVIRAIDDAVENLGAKDLSKNSSQALNALKFARKEWRRAQKFDAIADIIKKADGDPNRLKAGLKKFADNAKKTRGFSKQEIEALNKAAHMTAGEGVMKALGKFGLDLGSAYTFGNTALPVAATALGAPSLTAAGTAARVGQKMLVRGKAEQLLRVIEQGAADVQPAAIQGRLPNLSALLALPAGSNSGAIAAERNKLSQLLSQ